MSDQTKKIEELEAALQERDKTIAAQAGALKSLDVSCNKLEAERDTILESHRAAIESHQAAVDERDEIIDGQAETIKALEAERDRLKADPGLTPTITVKDEADKDQTYAVRVAKFRYKRDGVDEDSREYTVAELQADTALQAELIGKKVGFLEKVKPAEKAA